MLKIFQIFITNIKNKFVGSFALFLWNKFNFIAIRNESKEWTHKKYHALKMEILVSRKHFSHSFI